MKKKLFQTSRNKSNNDQEYFLGNQNNYNYAKKARHTRKKSKVKKVLLTILFIFLAMFVAGMIYTIYTIQTAPKIDADNVYSILNENSTIYDSKKKVIDTVYTGEYRKKVKYEDLPEDLINAYVALEDKTFWKHHGFNIVRILGAIKESLTSGGNVSGTSTISQQLARNVFLKKSMSIHTLRRKIIEAWYTIQIERKMTKKEIMEAYLNTIYLGFNSNGVEAASEAYFSKKVKDLTLAQYATLASLPQSPTQYAPVQLVSNNSVTTDSDNILKRSSHGTYIINDVAKSRRNLCLKLMREQGYISDVEYTEAINTSLREMLKPKFSNGQAKTNYFTDYVVEKVIKDLQKQQGLSYQNAWDKVYKGGLKIYSTLDSEAQKVVKAEFKENSNFPNPTNIIYDTKGNILNTDGNIVLYNYNNFFDKKKRFTFKKSEIKKKDDGSLILKKGKRLRFYKTTANNEVDYSIEFPKLYIWKEGHLYSISGGYMTIPQKFKEKTKNGNIRVSSAYVNSKEGKKAFIFNENGTVSVPEKDYVLNQKVIQPQAAMTIIDNSNGQVKAMVGGRKSKGKLIYNRATSTRQPGSSIKPLAVYSAALQQSAQEAKKGKLHNFVNHNIDSQGTFGWGNYITAGSQVINERTINNGRYWPSNSNGAFTGRQTLRTALKQSINTCAYKIFMQVGMDYSLNTVKKYGITSLVTDGSVNDKNAAALALGGMVNGVSTLEMANAYTVFPNNGTKTEEPICYTKVTDSDDEVLLNSDDVGRKRVLNESVAWIMKDMLQGVVQGGTGTNAAINGIAVGGKTGTTSNEYDIWFDGFTPSYTAALWIGNDINIQLTSKSDAAAALWGRIMSQIPNALKGTYKYMPESVEIHDREYFAPGTYGGTTYYNYNDKDKNNKNNNNTSNNGTNNYYQNNNRTNTYGNGGGYGNNGGGYGKKDKR